MVLFLVEVKKGGTHAPPTGSDRLNLNYSVITHPAVLAVGIDYG